MQLSRIPLYLIVFLSLPIALSSYRFLALDLELSFPEMHGLIENQRLAFLLHVSFAPIALIGGVLQIMPGLRRKYRTLHRWGGRLYGVAILISGGAGLIIAAHAAGGVLPQLGFGLLSVIWLITTFQGVRYARARNFAQHRYWMTLSFALTFAAVTLRLYLLGFMLAGFTYTEASVYLAWICWVPNLALAHWWVQRPAPALT